jgi:hypothetical protein
MQLLGSIWVGWGYHFLIRYAIMCISVAVPTTHRRKAVGGRQRKGIFSVEEDNQFPIFLKLYKP